MTTNSLRRQLEDLKKRGGHNDCPGCGYPSFKDAKVVTRVRSIHDPEPPPLRPCSVCGRPPVTIRVKGLQDKTVLE
jgi:hypothetical protein